MSERILSKYNLEILALADASQEYSGDLVAKLASRILDLEAENAALKSEIVSKDKQLSIFTMVLIWMLKSVWA